jgi:O-antigen ligase
MHKIAMGFALVLIFTIPWETAITFGAMGTLTRLIGLGLAGLWAISVLVKGGIRKLGFFQIVVFFFMLYNVASIFWTINFDLTITRVYTFLQLAMLSWILWDLFTNSESLQVAIQVFIFGGYLAIASSIINFVSGQYISTTDVGRYTGAGQNANELCIILSLSVPLAWHLASSPKAGARSYFLRVVNFLFIPGALFASILTASRTALVILVPGLLYILISARKVKFIIRFLVFTILIIGIIGVWSIIPQVTMDRLGTIGASIESNDLGGRVVLWDESMQVFQSHPLLGIGSGSLASPNILGTFAHNTFLSVLAELGILGFIPFMAILVIVLYQIFKMPRSYLFLWLTVFVILIISFFSLTWEYTKTTWFILNIMIMYAAIYNKRDIPVEYSTVPNNSLPGSFGDSNKPNVTGANV